MRGRCSACSQPSDRGAQDARDLHLADAEMVADLLLCHVTAEAQVNDHALTGVRTRMAIAAAN
jgi:hypothetical protein